MMIWIPSLSVVVFLLGVAAAMEWRAAVKRLRTSQRLAVQLEFVLTLIQGVQKHRGLSGQSSASAFRQREQLAQQLDRQWSDWPATIGSALPAVEAAISWRELRLRPTDFNYHCQLIDQLLTALALLERALQSVQQRSLAKGASLASPAPFALVTRCREIEDLGRVRGLSVRAAGHKVCPIDMAVQLRYLCRRLNAGALQKIDPAVGITLREIQQKLLDSTRVAITSERCYELLTPSIDRALDDLRHSLPSARMPSKSADLREGERSVSLRATSPSTQSPLDGRFHAANICAAVD